ncbi:hypothetical protein FKM82_000945 [Ascaphus truei]
MGQGLGVGSPREVLWEGGGSRGEVTSEGDPWQVPSPQRHWTRSQVGGATARRTIIVCCYICVTPHVSLLFPPSQQDPPTMEHQEHSGSETALHRSRLSAKHTTPPPPVAGSTQPPDE